MKKRLPIVLAILIALLTVALFGCASEQYGAGIDKNIPAVQVKDIYLDSGVIGKKVTLQGTISSQCGSNGCWFVLQDDTGQVFVNLAPNNMTLPPRMNKTAKVTGVVYPVEGQLQIIAQGVEVK